MAMDSDESNSKIVINWALDSKESNDKVVINSNSTETNNHKSLRIQLNNI